MLSFLKAIWWIIKGKPIICKPKTFDDGLVMTLVEKLEKNNRRKEEGHHN